MPPSTLHARIRQRRLLVDTVLLGVAGAVAAQAFTWLVHGSSWLFLHLLAGYTPPGLPNEGGGAEVIGPHGFWLVPVAAALGGLIVGLITQWLAPEAEGHGTDTVVWAFHRADGALRGRVPAVKLIASAITIGSGGSAGREGPIALVTAGVGSWWATFTGRTDRDRRLLLLVGAAAGLSAIFRSPVGTALMAIEVLYGDMDFEADALPFTALGAIVAYAVNGLVAGWDPLFRVPPGVGRLLPPLEYGWYIVLGVLAGVAAAMLPWLFYRTRDLFRAMKVPMAVKPAIGAGLAGVLAIALPQVIAGGYGWVQMAIDGKLALGALFLLAGAKWVATSLTVGSGGSGGIFAPSLYVGAMLGGGVAALAHQPPAPFVIVGMAAVFAGSAHVPIATLMMVTEMTGGYTLLVPAALAVILSYLVQVRLVDSMTHRSLYEAQVPTRADSPAHHSQHLEIALKLLREKKPETFEGSLGNVGELDLVSLLRAGVPVELPGDRRLVVGVLRESSPVVGTTVGESGRKLDGGDTTIIAILRGEHMLVPTGATVLEAGDRLVLVARADALATLRNNVERW